MASTSSPIIDETLIARFLALGFDQRRATDTVKNAALSASIIELAEQAGVAGGCDKTIGNLIYTTATKLTGDAKQGHRRFLGGFIAKGELSSAQQLTEAIKYLERLPADQPVNEAEFKDASGVGITVTTEQVVAAVGEVIATHKDELLARRYQFPVGPLIKEMKDKLKWADGKVVKDEIDAQILALLGPRTAEDQAAPKQAKAKDATASGTSKAEKAAVKATKPDLPFTAIKLRDIQAHEGKRVMLRGWAHNVRQGGKKLWFVELRDGTGFVQAVLNGTETITRESTLEVYGTITRPPGTNVVRFAHGLEIAADYWEFIQCAPVDLEFELNQDSSTSEQFNKRHLVLRREKVANYMKLRSVVMQAFRAHYMDRGYFEVTPPTLVQTQAEGGSELFSLKYFEEPAYLTQSSQLYLETVCPSMGDVFCIASSYRAEESRTRRHLAEYTHVEAERPFITFEDLLSTLEDLVCDVLARVLDGPFGDVLRSLNKDVKLPERPFLRMNYVDGLQFLKDNQIYKPDGTTYEYGDDIPEAPERRMTDMIGRPILFCRFPVEAKAFYMAKCPIDPRVTESVDLLMPGVGEIIGGSMRIWQYDELMAAYKREGLDPSPYYWFTDQRKYGSFPHGGYGLGLERFLVWMLGDDHVRNVCLYPRYRGRCRP